MLKGVKIERALPSNCLDIYALFKEAIKTGSITYPPVSELEAKSYYPFLIQELSNPLHFFYVARRGRQFVGFIHGFLAKRPWEDGFSYIHGRSLFVTDKKRKLGIGKALLDRMLEDSKKLGVSKMEFLCSNEMETYWTKKRSARKVLNYMVMGE